MNKYFALVACGAILSACDAYRASCSEHSANAHAPILFEYNSAKITPEAQSRLDDGLVFLKGHRFKKIHLDAYSDEQGGYTKHNWELSERRVNAVRDYMISQGIAADRITTDFHGIEEGKPYPTYRRVEVTIK